MVGEVLSWKESAIHVGIYTALNKDTLWLNVCSSIGVGFIHSIDEVVLPKKIHPRLAERDSHMIHMNMRTDTKEIKDPREEMTFHMVNASG